MNQEFNSTLLQIIKILDAELTKKGNSPFKILQSDISLVNSGKNLVTVTPYDLIVAGLSCQDKLTIVSMDYEIESAVEKHFSRFLQQISDRFIRLNHLGISYFCENLDKETVQIKNLTSQNKIPLYDDPTPDSDHKWLFMGNTNKIDDPLFEIVLNKGSQGKEDFWTPHFQIDIDTTLSIDEIKQITDKCFEGRFVKWQLAIPGHGTVLAMGILGKIGNTKIALGIGTDKRDTEFHRKNILKQI